MGDRVQVCPGGDSWGALEACRFPTSWLFISPLQTSSLSPAKWTQLPFLLHKTIRRIKRDGLCAQVGALGELVISIRPPLKGGKVGG